METETRQSQPNKPIYGTIKGSIQIQRNLYGSDDVLAFCCLKVALLDADNQWVAEESTNDDGDFAFLGIALGTYTIVFPDAIVYQKQKFLPQNSAFHYEFPVELTPEKPLADNLHVHYGLPKNGVIQGYPVGSAVDVNVLA
jgi:hypothetical protein